MAPVIYKLIDGAFLEKMVKEYGTAVGEDLFSRVDWRRVCANAFRCIYYDALPTKKTTQSEEQFSAIEKSKLDYLNRLRELPNIQVRDGLTRLRTKSSGRTMSEVFEQKGVDTWIAVDAIQYALTGLADEIHIYTSDSDLYPVFEALQNTRCRGTLYYQDGRAASELIYSADRAEIITFSTVVGWAENSGHLKSMQSDIKLDWLAGPEFENEANRFQLVFDVDQFGCNMYSGDRFVSSCRARAPMLLADWMAGHGYRISYREITAAFDTLKL